jgi:hypothetical protein
VGEGGRNDLTQTLYAHMNKIKNKNKKEETKKKKK